MGSFRSTRTCDESASFADADAITETTESSQFVPKSRWRRSRQSGIWRQTYGRWRRTLWGSGRLVPAWEFLAKNWQKAWRPDGGASRRRHVPKLPSEGRHCATWKSGKSIEHISCKGSTEAHIRFALRLSAIYAPKSIFRQNRELCKVLHIDSKAEQELEKSVIAEETKKLKIIQSIFMCVANVRQPNQWVITCVYIIVAVMCRFTNTVHRTQGGPIWVFCQGVCSGREGGREGGGWLAPKHDRTE